MTESTREKFTFWLLDTCANLDNDKIDFRKFLILLEEGAKKCYTLLYGERKQTVKKEAEASLKEGISLP